MMAAALVAALTAVTTALNPSFRRGAASDTPLIMSTMLKEKMNPLGLNHGNFLVAEEGGACVGFGQVRPLGGDGSSWELASLYVEPSRRGDGIGQALVRRLLATHVESGQSLDEMYLLTLSSTVGFYEKLSFTVVDEAEVPKEMAFEVSAGKAVSFLLGNTLVCMRHRDAGPPS